MIGIHSSPERFFYSVAGGKWRFGPVGNTKLLKKLVGHEHMAVAMRNDEECVLRHLMGFDNNALIPMYSSERSYDEKALRQFRNDPRELEENIRELEENIKEATDEGEYDLADKYKRQLRKLKKTLKKLKKTLKKWTKGDLIAPYKSRPLNEGNPIKSITHMLRQRSTRVIRALERNGFEDEAADLIDSYKVGDYSVVFYQSISQFKWILASDEESCASRAP